MYYALLWITFFIYLLYYIYRPLREGLTPIDCPNGMDLEKCSPIATCPADKFCYNLCTPRCVYKPATYPEADWYSFYGNSIGFSLFILAIVFAWLLTREYDFMPFNVGNIITDIHRD